ncbi:alpha-L-fucosidase [Sinomicrobium weinanense]|uniref:alpha-L-fucosidase n=2 Tax=Sinomicrobium weinanense TaxID=2842200 RepID=A0A926JQW5_9FLAO|nr:alpha-L-fucosidase [Sinomicrobium weinanense]MBC9795709.1 alpha-L-fucosidase [Sinomicrobium weinanense]MBU3125272.1 alpha-L-fucosidase [Sinomicrobium weinanense]
MISTTSVSYFCSVLFLLYTATAGAQKKITDETEAQKKERMAWWAHDRFGMFIHWGLYALPARHEWVKQRERMTDEQYQVYFDEFNPDLYNPKQWAKQAKKAGMKYAVITTKHHEGFCLFDSEFTDYKSTNTKAGRDLIAEFVEAFRAEGLKVGFYYSLIDWHHPDFTIDRIHPQRIDEGSEADYDAVNKGRDMKKYRKYLFNQVRELLTNYGKIDIIWFDFSYPGKNGKGKDDWNSVELLKMARELQPGIIVDNRLDLNDYADGADFETPEQVKTEELAKYKGKMWETCQTFSGSWGYYRDENTWKSQRQLLDLLITSVANGGNLLLNVGPTGRGEFDYRAINALDGLGGWMHANSRSVYGCTFAPEDYKAPTGTKLTYNPETNRLYLHLFEYPSSGRLVLPGYKNKIRYTQFLHDNSEIGISAEGPSGTLKNEDLILLLPEQKPGMEIPVVEITLK